jgi:hypothetical protein
LAGLGAGVFAGNSPGTDGTGFAGTGWLSSEDNEPPPVRGDLGPLMDKAASSAEVLRSVGGRGMDSFNDVLLDTCFSDRWNDPLFTD